MVFTDAQRPAHAERAGALTPEPAVLSGPDPAEARVSGLRGPGCCVPLESRWRETKAPPLSLKWGYFLLFLKCSFHSELLMSCFHMHWQSWSLRLVPAGSLYALAFLGRERDLIAGIMKPVSVIDLWASDSAGRARPSYRGPFSSLWSSMRAWAGVAEGFRERCWSPGPHAGFAAPGL